MAPEEVRFKLSVKVPGTLKLWYSALVALGAAFVLFFASAFVAAIMQGIDASSFSPVYASGYLNHCSHYRHKRLADERGDRAGKGVEMADVDSDCGDAGRRI